MEAKEKICAYALCNAPVGEDKGRAHNKKYCSPYHSIRGSLWNTQLRQMQEMAQMSQETEK